jgi:hypothetical protein
MIQLIAAILTLALGVLGCDGPRGDVSGRVTYKGQAVACGSVTFVGKDRLPVQGFIQADGRYTLVGVLCGDNQVAVNSPDPDAPGRDPKASKVAFAPVDRSKWFEIPAHFGDPRKSGLTFRIQKGRNAFDIRLE